MTEEKIQEEKKETKKKKKWPWIVGGIVLLLVVIGIASNSNTTTQNTNNTDQNIQSKEEAKTPLQVDTGAFIAEFDKNQLQAEEKYKDKLVKFTGKIGNISEDILGNPFLSIEPSNADEYYFGTSIQCLFKEKSELTSLSNGQKVTLQGVVKSQDLGIIGVEECKIVQ